MATYEIIDTIDGEPTFPCPLAEIWKSCKRGGAIKVLDPLEYHTDRQRRWYKGVCLRGLSDWNGDTMTEWDVRLKNECGGDELLKKVPYHITLMGQDFVINKLTTVGVGKKNMTLFIENILSKSITEGWPVTPPDPELRQK